MLQSISKLFILLTLIVSLCICDSIILKTHDYGSLQFNNVPDGLSYPQYIKVVDSLNNNISLYFYNFTSQQLLVPPINFNKGFNSTCQFAVQTFDYGYYAKFTFYRLIGQCSNSTHTQVYTIKLYRSGDSVVTPGGITPRTADQSNCNFGPLRTQFFYSAGGFSDTFIYRFCVKKQSSKLSLYKQYIIDSKTAYIFKQDAIERVVGNYNISLVDMQPAIGPDGKANAYLTEKYGLIINNGNKFNQRVWAIPDRQKPYKIQRICWSNKFAILTQGYIYFVEVIFNQTDATSVNLLRKSSKININTTANCNFFTIGHNAICSIWDAQSNVTTWYIYGQTTKDIKINVTQIFKGKYFKPYISEDLCTTNSFYQDNARYQFNFNALLFNNNQQNKIKKVQNNLFIRKQHLIKRKLTAQFGIQNFIDFNSNFFTVVLNNLNTTTQQLLVGNYDKSNKRILTIESLNITKNATIRLEYQSYTSYSSVVFVIITEPLNKNITTFIRYNQISVSPYFQRISSYIVPVAMSEIGYFKNYNSANYYFTVKTTIQKNTYARLILNGTSNYDLRYRYEIETDSFKVCSIYGADDQMLMYRQDSNSLVVMRIGFRYKNSLVLDDVKFLKQYSGFQAKCSHDGLLIHNPTSKQIIALDNNLQVKYQLNLSYDDFLFTKSLILAKNGAFVQIRTLQKGDLLGVYKWNLQDLVTNIHSIGFFNIKENNYYQFGNQEILKIQ